MENLHLTSKQMHRVVAERSGGCCELCKSNHMVQHHHQIKGFGKRKQHESVESVIALCWNCHHGNNGIHGMNGRALDIKLKQRLQDTYFDQGHDEDEVRAMMGGRIY